MNDFAYVAIVVAFFALAGLFVKACDRIIGPDEAFDARGRVTPATPKAPADDPTQLAA